MYSEKNEPKSTIIFFQRSEKKKVFDRGVLETVICQLFVVGCKEEER